MGKRKTKEQFEKEMHDLAASRGGKCLSRYANCSTKITWQCGEGHIWYSVLYNIRNAWCPECAGNVKKTLHDMQLIAASCGGKCLSTKYINNRTKLLWECKNGHQWAVPYQNIQEHWCPACAGRLPKTLEDMRKMAESRGGKCLSTVYKNTGSKLRWQCSKGHEWEAVPYSLICAKSWCPICGAQQSCDTRKVSTWKAVCELVQKRDGKCVTGEYLGPKKHHVWQCDKGHIWTAQVGNILYSGKWCPHCNFFKNEAKCRTIFEKLFQKKFPRTRQALGGRLELDGYCEELKLAFEYNGRQHYERVPHWHRTPEDFPAQQARDVKKKLLCAERGIMLVVIPYTINNLLEYIELCCQGLGFLV